MSDLIKRARLSRDEQHQAVFAGPPTENMTWNEASAQRVADAQLRKALMVVVEWLEEMEELQMVFGACENACIPELVERLRETVLAVVEVR